ncbi:MAG: LysM peptidoglycan-binding domain-containing protein [Desulfosporosinus sp.]|nr:LysM peptidoglycan-binding domain-containing protein [Desulfosporosinus sp.]
MYYRVVSGDTLHNIAIHFGTTVSNLMDLNSQISNPNQIYPGERIKVSSDNHWNKKSKSKSWQKKSSSTSWSNKHHGHGW